MQNDKNYVLNHNYGYCNAVEKKTINKLKLRCIEDLRVYVEDVINNAFIATCKNNIVMFEHNQQQAILIIETL